MAAPIELWINIYEGDAVPSGGPHPRLFRRDYPAALAPDEGDLIYIAHSDEDEEGTVGTYVYQRFWTHDGRLVLEMQGWHIDPTGLAVEHVDRDRSRAYWSSADGDIISMLLGSGWEER